MKLFKKIPAFLLSAALLTGCSVEAPPAEAETTAAAEPAPISAERSFEAEETYVKMLGRTHSEEGILWLAHSASGIEFTVKGTKCAVKIIGDNMMGNEGNQARFAVEVDGERVLDEMITEHETVYDVFSYDEEKEVTVTVLKLSEPGNSTFGIDEITVTASEDIAPTAEKSPKIEFIGDSITCGYGVDDEDRNHHFATDTEDATKAYAYKTARLLGADYSLVAYSGHGIISGYTQKGKKVSAQQLPKKYETYAVSGGSSYEGFRVSEADWDFSKFVPDYVVINLGTNDSSYTGKDEELIAEYTAAYVEFLKTVREKNPGAHIICTLGVMGADLYDAMSAAAEQYTAETGDENISVFRLSTQDGSTGYAADWHPTAATHDKAAEEMSEYIKTLMNG